MCNQMIHSGNKTSFKTTFVIDDGTKPYNYTITKPAKNFTGAPATPRVGAAAAGAAPAASGLTASGLRGGGVGAVDRSDHGNDGSQPPADVEAWIAEQQGRKQKAEASAPAAKGLRSKNTQ
jgi:hypothetical protein